MHYCNLSTGEAEKAISLDSLASWLSPLGEPQSSGRPYLKQRTNKMDSVFRITVTHTRPPLSLLLEFQPCVCHCRTLYIKAPIRIIYSNPFTMTVSEVIILSPHTSNLNRESSSGLTCFLPPGWLANLSSLWDWVSRTYQSVRAWAM